MNEFAERWRERLQLEHNQRRTALLAEIAAAKLERRHQYLTCGPEDDHVEVLEASLRQLDAEWADDCREWSTEITKARALVASMRMPLAIDDVLANLEPDVEVRIYDNPPPPPLPAEVPELTDAEFADAVERLTEGLIPRQEDAA